MASHLVYWCSRLAMRDCCETPSTRSCCLLVCQAASPEVHAGGEWTLFPHLGSRPPCSFRLLEKGGCPFVEWVRGSQMSEEAAAIDKDRFHGSSWVSL